MNATLNLQVPGDLNDFLEREAARRTCSKSAVVREILLNHVRAQAPTEQAAKSQVAQPEKVAA